MVLVYKMEGKKLVLQFESVSNNKDEQVVEFKQIILRLKVNIVSDIGVDMGDKNF